jgi:hypothetical protein
MFLYFLPQNKNKRFRKMRLMLRVVEKEEKWKALQHLAERHLAE